jgi:hypothetical protein
MVRAMKVTDIITANATSAYVDIFIEVNLFKFHNRARNRRFLFSLSLCAGSFASVFAYRRF